MNPEDIECGDELEIERLDSAFALLRQIHIKGF